MIAAVHTAIQGWDIVFALVVLLVAIVLEKLVPPLPWLAWITLFGVFLFGFAICVTW